MADGKVTIAVDVNGNQLKGLNSDLDSLEGKSGKASIGIKEIATSLGLVKIASAAINVLKNSLDGAIDRFDTMQKFPKVMDALGYSTEQSDAAMKKLSNGIDGLPTTLQEVVAQTQQMTSVTGDLDKSTDTVIALNNAFLASGASSEDASRGMMQFNQMLATGKADAKSWQSLQETMPLALQKTAEAMGYLGRTAQTDLLDALQSGEKTFDDFQNALIELGTGTGELADLAQKNSLGIKTSFQNLGTSVTKGLANMITKLDEIIQKATGKSIAQNIDSLKGAINAAFSSITESMDKVLPVIEKSKGLMNNFSKGLKSTSPEIERFSSNIGLMGLSFGKLKYVALDFVPEILKAFSNLYSGLEPILSDIQQAVGIWGKAFGEIAEQVFPVFLQSIVNTFNLISSNVVPIISSLSEGFLILSETITKVLVDDIVPALISFYEQFSETFTNISETILPIIQLIIENVVLFVSELIESFGSLFSGDNSIVNSFMNAFNAIVEVALPILQSALELIKNILSDLATFWAENGEQISNIVKLAFEIISTVIQTTMNYIGPFLQSAWENIRSVVEMVWDAIKNIVEAALNIIEGILNVVMGVISGDWSQAWEGIQQIAQGVLDMIVAIVENALNGIATAFKIILQTIVTVVQSQLNMVKDIFNRVVDSIQAAFEVDWGSIGSNIINGIIGGISGAVGGLVDAAVNAASSAFNAAKSFLGINSPSRLFREGIGRFIPEGMAVGIDKFAYKASDAMKNMSNMLESDMALDVAGYGAILPDVPAIETTISGFGASSAASQVISNANNTSRTINNTPNVTIYATWEGKDDIRKTMEEMGWITNVDERGRLE